MRHLTVVYAIPDDIEIDEFFVKSTDEHFEQGRVIARDWCDAVAQKNSLLVALLYVQQQVE